MIIKVCGIKTKENISFLSEADIDMVGLNFYKPSVRYLDNKVNPSLFDSFQASVKRVGVFVNESQHTILELSRRFKLDLVQLHGDEDATFCGALAKNIPIIKVFRVDEKFDFAATGKYSEATYFLFDTPTVQYGGSGRKFNWDMLEGYEGEVPFLLSGGIGPDDYNKIQQIDHQQFYGIDINSKFESKPGIKDKNLILPFIDKIRVENKQ